LIGQYPEILEKTDTKYFCEIFWALEPESYPETAQKIKEQE
jgi:hypothetical protein